MRVWFVLAALLLAGTGWGATVVVGDCAEGEYRFDNLYDALREADGHGDVNIIVCGERELRWGRTVHVDDLWMGGGTVRSEGEKIRIVGDEIVIEDLNAVGTRLKITATGDVLLKNVHFSAPGYRYCVEINATGDVTLDNVTLSGCEYGVHVRRADELNAWRVLVEGPTEALKIEGKNVERIYMNPVEVVKEIVVEKIVERNVPVREITYTVPPEIREELHSCKQLVAVLHRKKGELERKVHELTAKASSGDVRKAYPDVWAAAGILALGLGAGYLLGRM